MTEVNTADRVVVSVTATDSGDWQVVSVPTGFQGIVSTLFAENNYLHGFVRHEDGEQWEVYDFDGGDDTKLLQVTSISGTVTLARPATPYDSSKSDGSRMDAGSGTHTMTLSLGSGTLKRIFRELSPFWKTFTSADASPSVAGYRWFKTNGTTMITRFDDLTNGQGFWVRWGGSDIVIQNNSDIVLFGATNQTLSANNPAIYFAVEAGVAKQMAGALAPLDEDDFASNSPTRPASQQSTKAYIASQILDQDDFASNSATKAPSQQSVKAYVDDTADGLGDRISALFFDTRAAFVTAAPTPDDGTIIAAAGFDYMRNASSTAIADLPGWDPVNPSPYHWGATGTGGSGDAAPFDAFLGIGGQLETREGSFLTNPVLDPGVNSVLSGAGPALTTLKRNGVGNFINTGSDYVTIEKMTLDLQRSTIGGTTSGQGVSASGSYITVRDLVIKDFGVADDGTGGGTGVLMSDTTRGGNNRLYNIDSYPNPDTQNNIGWLMSNRDTSFAYSIYVKDAKSGIGYAHELKNYTYHCNLWGLIAESSANALVYGQTTDDDRAADFNMAAGIVAKYTDRAVLFGKAWYNNVVGVVHDKTTNQGLVTPATAELSGGSSYNALHSLLTAGDSTYHVKTDGTSNYVEIAVHGAGEIAHFDNGATKNVVMVTHPGTRTSVRADINNGTNTLADANANVVWCPATGERIGSMSGKFWDSLYNTGVTPNSTHSWVHEHLAQTVTAHVTAGNAGDTSGFAVSTARDGNNHGRLYHVTGATGADNYWSFGLYGTPDIVRVNTAGIRLSSGAAFYCGSTKVIDTNGSLLAQFKTVATLPSASPDGQQYEVTDATVTTRGTTVAGGGSNLVPVISRSGAWKIN